MVTYCRTLSSRSTGLSPEGFTSEPGEEGSTVLHLAAGLGYTKLTTALLRWRQDDTSLALEKEVNLAARDHENCTPLVIKLIFIIAFIRASIAHCSGLNRVETIIQKYCPKGYAPLFRSEF